MDLQEYKFEYSQKVPWFQCIVAAGSVFARNFPNTCLIEGIPARIIKEHIKWK